MAHQLTRTRGVYEMAYTGKTPWHGLGQQLEAGADIETWKRQAGMEWQAEEAMVRFYADGALVLFEDKRVLYRSDTKAPLSVVSQGYKPVQPGEVLEFFRDLTDANGFQLETAGTLFGGRRLWALAKVTGEMPILDKKDTVKGYLLLATSLDGTLATTARWTTVRVVCNNTLGMALGAKPEFLRSHRSVFDHDEAKAELGIRGNPREEFEQAMEQFRTMARTKTDSFGVVDLTLRAFGHNPAEITEKQLDGAMANRAFQEIGAIATSGQQAGASLTGGSATVWGWLNAVTQYVDHHARARSQNNRLDSAFFGRGDSLKRKALEVAVEYAGGKVAYEETEALAGSQSLLDAVLANTRQAA